MNEANEEVESSASGDILDIEELDGNKIHDTDYALLEELSEWNLSDHFHTLLDLMNIRKVLLLQLKLYNTNTGHQVKRSKDKDDIWQRVIEAEYITKATLTCPLDLTLRNYAGSLPYSLLIRL